MQAVQQAMLAYRQATVEWARAEDGITFSKLRQFSSASYQLRADDVGHIIQCTVLVSCCGTAKKPTAISALSEALRSSTPHCSARRHGTKTKRAVRALLRAVPSAT